MREQQRGSAPFVVAVGGVHASKSVVSRALRA